MFQCSHTCGHGLQKRKVTCHRVNMFSWVDPETTEVTRCTAKQMPKEVRTCTLPSCEATVVWVPGEWSQVVSNGSIHVLSTFNHLFTCSVCPVSSVERGVNRKDAFFAEALRERKLARGDADMSMEASTGHLGKESVTRMFVGLKAVRI